VCEEKEMSNSDPDLVNALIERMQKGTADQLDEHMRDAGQIKSEEEAASQRRLEEMWMHEHARQQAITQAQSEQKRQEQMLLRGVLIALAVLIVAAVVLVMLLGCAGPRLASGSLSPFLFAYA